MSQNNTQELDDAMVEFSKDNHIWEVLRSMMITINLQNRENRQMGEFINVLSNKLDDKCEMSDRPLRPLKYDFKMSPREVSTLRKASTIYNNFMNIDKRVRYKKT